MRDIQRLPHLRAEAKLGEVQLARLQGSAEHIQLLAELRALCSLTQRRGRAVLLRAGLLSDWQSIGEERHLNPLGNRDGGGLCSSGAGVVARKDNPS